MKKNISLKETLLSTLVNGKNVLNDIEVTRKNGIDISTRKDDVSNKMAQLNPHSLSLVVSEIYNVTKEAKTIRFISSTGYLPPFEAGQYINVFVEIDGVRTSRPYSISSSPRQRAYYEITVAKISKGFVSDYFIDKVKVGDRFEANGPAGTFHFNSVFHSKKSVFIAGGSGITPFMSMSREILEAGLDREITLIYGCRNEKVAIFNDELKEFAKKYTNFKYELVLSDDVNFAGHKGFIDAKLISFIVGKNVNEYTYYLCGPQVMADFCTKALEDLKVKGRNIRHEMFGSAQNIVEQAGWPKALKGTEIFKLSVEGRVLEARADESLLTTLERNKIRINVCCRSGECSLCRVKLISGKVFIPRGVLLRHADEKYGYIHSCKAYPISDLEIQY